MATNLNIDNKLLTKAQRICGMKTKRETVNYALEQIVRRHEQMEILDLFGKVDFRVGYDHKQGRRKR